MTRFPKITFESIKTVSIADRPRKVDLQSLSRPLESSAIDAMGEYLASLPDVLKARELRLFAQRLAALRRQDKHVALMLGGHVIKTGLAPIVIDLMATGLVTSVSMNSAAAIHDCESALFGRTSEDVAANLQDGTFGMSKETGDFINGMLAKYFSVEDVGYGEALGLGILDAEGPNREISILAKGVEFGIPVSVHAAIGTDIVHQQPSMRGDVTGEMSFRDFRLFATICGALEGGAAINIGSSVIMPEVFLKAVTVARNLGIGGRGLTTANFDMIQHYRPQMNVLERPTQPDGQYFSFTGHHELMIPLFAAAYKYYVHTA